MTRYYVRQLGIHPHEWYITSQAGYGFSAQYLHSNGTWNSSTCVWDEDEVQHWNGLFDSKEEALALLETLNIKPDEIDA